MGYVRFLLLSLLLSSASIANSALLDRSNGMIYDDVLGITWLADASYAKTSGYDDDGRISFDEANIWAEQLSYGGFDDWRLHKASQPSDTCENGVGYDYDCIQNELVYMFMVNLGFKDIPQPVTSYIPNENYYLFQNLNLTVPYWSGTLMIPSTAEFGYYTTGLGQAGVEQNAVDTIVSWGAWAVRDGDVIAASVPEPSTLVICFLGIIGITLRRVKNNFS